MRSPRIAVAVCAAAVALALSGCSDTADSGSSDSASKSLCEQLPASAVVELFTLQPDSGEASAGQQVTTEADASTSNTGPGCKWLTGENALGINVVTVAGGRDRLASISTGPVDMGEGVELFPPKQTDAMCQAEFTATAAPTDQALTIVVLPDLSLTRPPNPPADWYRRAAPAAKTVMKALGWLR